MKIFLPLTLLVASLLVVPALLMSCLMHRHEIERAAARHEVARRALVDVTVRMQRTEGVLVRMTTSPKAVEDEALAQMRMVRPGEKLVLIEQLDPRAAP